MVKSRFPVQVLLPKIMRALHKLQEDIVGMVVVVVAVATAVIVVDSVVDSVDMVIEAITVVVVVTGDVVGAVCSVSLIHVNSSRSVQDIVAAVMVNVEMGEGAVAEVITEAHTKVVPHLSLHLLQHLLRLRYTGSRSRCRIMYLVSYSSSKIRSF